MAIRSLVANANGSFMWEGLAASDTGEPVTLPKGGAQIAVHALGTFGGTVSLQGTIDGTNWFTLLTSPGGTEVTFTAAGYAEIASAVRAIRPSAATGVSDVDVNLSVF